MRAVSLCIPELCLWKAEVAAACLEAPVAPLAVSRLDILDHLWMRLCLQVKQALTDFLQCISWHVCICHSWRPNKGEQPLVFSCTDRQSNLHTAINAIDHK